MHVVGMMQASVPLLCIQTDEIHLKQAENTNLVLSSTFERQHGALQF